MYRAQPWRRRELHRFYADIIKPGDVVFDIGAHVGSRTSVAVALGAHCIAVEPQPAFVRLLRRLYRNTPSVTLVEAAVGSEPGTAQLQISRRHPTVSTLSTEWIRQVADTDGFRQVHWDHSVEVPVTTLDALMQVHGEPQFCKIDVEGMEASILAGLSRPIALLALEYLPAALEVAEACIERLCELGAYEFNLTEGETHRYRLPDWVGRERVSKAMTEAARSGRSGDLYARLKHPHP